MNPPIACDHDRREDFSLSASSSPVREGGPPGRRFFGGRSVPGCHAIGSPGCGSASRGVVSGVLETPRIIFEDFESDHVPPAGLDRLLADGWRHAGCHFYRYNFAIHEGALTEVIPLRIQLENYTPSKSQRRTWRNNRAAGFRVDIRPTQLDEEKEALFHQHKGKFSENVPESLRNFLSRCPDSVPCEGREVVVYDGRRLIGVSFFDVGEAAISAIYGMYDLAYGRFGLGLYTMLLEMEHARSVGKRFYYHGYCYRCASFYDYKKRFRALQAYDWNGRWEAWTPSS